MELEGRVVLITGAARRVGRAIALRLARSRCAVAIHYHTSRAAAEGTAAECRAAGAQAAALAADLADPAAARGCVESVLARFGRLDVLINNASTFEPMALDDFDLSRWDLTLRVNLTAPLVLAHAAREVLRSAGGRIVNLCDAGTPRPWPSHLAYMVSKAGLETLTKALARAFAPRVNVVGIAPGVVDWPGDYDASMRARLTEKIPLARAGVPEDVAAAVEYFLRDGDYLTGVILPIDGGRRLV